MLNGVFFDEDSSEEDDAINSAEEDASYHTSDDEDAQYHTESAPIDIPPPKPLATISESSSFKPSSLMDKFSTTKSGSLPTSGTQGFDFSEQSLTPNFNRTKEQGAKFNPPHMLVQPGPSPQKRRFNPNT